MRKFLSVILCICCFLAFISCSEEDTIKEYTGTSLVNLTFQRVDYMGGYTRTYVVDFENNSIKARAYLPDGNNQPPEFELLANFSEEEETDLINKLYSWGLFDIDDDYPSPPGVMDGGGWDLAIEYTDGTVKRSTGSNNSPSTVFADCAKAFYDVCGNGILANVPSTYYTPPEVSYNFEPNSGLVASSYGARADYKWNGFESTGNSVYEINEDTDFTCDFYDGQDYKLILYTGNYGDYDKFKRYIITSYDYNEESTNEKIVREGRWFEHKEFSLELNKIYVLRLEFKNGDFVEYTFNTKTA